MMEMNHCVLGSVLYRALAAAVQSLGDCVSRTVRILTDQASVATQSVCVTPRADMMRVFYVARRLRMIHVFVFESGESTVSQRRETGGILLSMLQERG